MLLGFPITPDKFDEAYQLSKCVDRFQIFIGNMDMLSSLFMLTRKTIDNMDTLDALEEYLQASGAQFNVLLKVDCGYQYEVFNKQCIFI